MTDTPNQPDPTDPTGDERELEELIQQAKDLNLELKVRGASVPLFPVRMEALVDFVFPQGTPERQGFELFFRRRHVAILTEAVSMAKRQELLRGVNGSPHGPLEL